VKVIGQLWITFEWSDWRAADIWWIQGVYVHPDYRRKGLFRALYQHAKAKSQEAGACGLRLYADVGNVKAQDTVCSVYTDLSCEHQLVRT
jgi:GNAT superfamily N-acetyltransferase